MKRCEETRGQIAFYLDDEIKGDELAEFEAHLDGCAGCRRACEDERSFLALVRDARPLRVAPDELRARVEQILSNAPAPYAAPPELRQRVERMVWRATAFHMGGVRRAWLLAVCAAFALAFVGLVALRKDDAVPRPSEFALLAVDAHQRYLRGRLPLDITSHAPKEISGWFSGKVSFSVELPSYQEASGQEKLYSLEGARLLFFNKNSAAYIAYQMRRRPISLVVTANSMALPSGGEEIAMKEITFHYDSIDGYKVMTWTHRGLTYALVSDLDEPVRESCVVCHEGTKDRDFIESLKPKSE
jgi:mycothiol system anti-sigma-R factor